MLNFTYIQYNFYNVHHKHYKLLKHVFVTIVKTIINAVRMVQEDSHSTTMSQPMHGMFAGNPNTCQW